MKKLSAAIVTALFLSSSFLPLSASAASLDARVSAVAAIASHTAAGNIPQLKTALADGLDKGLTVNEIKEVLIQLYAYCGFPRSLNGVTAFMGVLQNRHARGIEDTQGPESTPMPPDLDRDRYGAEVRAALSGVPADTPPSGYQVFVPALNDFLKQHLFADIFFRDALSPKYRELATVAALASMTGTEPQIRAHLAMALRAGASPEELTELLAVIQAQGSGEQAQTAADLLKEVQASAASI